MFWFGRITILSFTISKYRGMLLYKSISVYLGMKKKTFEITKRIYFLLKKEGELSVKQIANQTGSKWETIIIHLNFLKEVGVLKERKGKKTYREERLFSLK